MYLGYGNCIEGSHMILKACVCRKKGMMQLLNGPAAR